jgi:hypothetical protein
VLLLLLLLLLLLGCGMLLQLIWPMLKFIPPLVFHGSLAPRPASHPASTPRSSSPLCLASLQY